MHTAITRQYKRTDFLKRPKENTNSKPKPTAFIQTWVAKLNPKNTTQTRMA